MAAACYALNTILQKDPSIHDKMTAVRLTMDLIARAVEERPEELDLSIGDYRTFIGA